jgi:phosphoglycolate phosphatase
MNQRKAVRCKKCGSFERTRLFWLYVGRLNMPKGSRVLHIAPEKGLYDKLSSNPDIEYIVADIDPGRYAFAENCQFIDLTDMEAWPDSGFDYIFHIHVIEHIPCNLAYPMFHLHRLLKPEGTHLCIIPFLSGHYDESLADIGDAERTRRFGQYDHVRRLGREDVCSHLGKIVRLPDSFDATRDFSEEDLRDANIPENHWRGFHIGTVLQLRKSDYRLSFGQASSAQQ